MIQSGLNLIPALSPNFSTFFKTFFGVANRWLLRPMGPTHTKHLGSLPPDELAAKVLDQAANVHTRNRQSTIAGTTHAL